MSDIVERLRQAADIWGDYDRGATYLEAADTIERLRAEVADCDEVRVEMNGMIDTIDKLRAELAQRGHCPDDAKCRDETVRALTAEVEALRTVAAQVLADMQAQGVLLEWQTLLGDAIAARSKP